MAKFKYLGRVAYPVKTLQLESEDFRFKPQGTQLGFFNYYLPTFGHFQRNQC